MTYGLIALLIVTFIATFWAKHLAQHRRRHVSGWSFATAMLPPLVLILWLLPTKRSA